MSNYPTSLDDDSTLPAINDNINEIGGDAINALRDAVFQVEQALGTNIAGTAPNLAARLGIFINPDGSPNASVLTSLGLITLPITNSQIIDNAGIPESKLTLDYRTQDLFNYIKDLSKDINLALGWINISGIKLEPHLLGAIYRHDLSQIDVSEISNQFLNNKFRQLRDNTNSYTLVNDINNELLYHQWADGYISNSIKNIITNNGFSYPSNYAHIASGLFINTSRFAFIPQDIDDLQQLADFIDSTSLFLIGTRLQNLYSNGISRTSRSSNLIADGYGQSIVPTTAAIAYLLINGQGSIPVDDINHGDDIIQFMPSALAMSNNSFDEQFALVKVGDIITINYGTVEVQFIIKEKKYNQNGGNKIYLVRVNGKNLLYSNSAIARIDRPLFNTNKYGVLSLAAANNQFSGLPSLIVGSSRGAQTLGIGFNSEVFDHTHYMLYLALYPNGNILDGYTILPGIDVTGNQGMTPGLYTLNAITKNTNDALRKSGYNYRFSSFSYNGEFGIMLSDSYNNASFSILSAVVANDGSYNTLATNLAFPNNVIDVISNIDPLGFGFSGSNIASPPLLTSYASAEASQIPTKILVPLKRNTFYVNGIEKERLNIDYEEFLDQYGDGYWVGTVLNQQIFPGPSGRVSTTYSIPLDLGPSKLNVGKTLVIQSLNNDGSLIDFGRFIISDVEFTGCLPNSPTNITVYDAVHAHGSSPATTLPIGSRVAIYFDSSSVSFNKETATDFTNVSPFKRHFEVYIDQNANTFTHERGRINISGGTLVVNGVSLRTYSELAKLDIIKISSKLRGYQFGSVNKITLHINNLNNVTGIFTGYLCSYDGVSYTHLGPLTTGHLGEVVRFYDETNIDFIDITYDINNIISNFSNSDIDFQLFPSLSLDEEIMLIGTCQLNDSLNQVTQIVDVRQFGNVSEDQLSTSAINFVNSGNRLLHTNGVIKGFDIITHPFSGNHFDIMGGTALVNGNFININNCTVTIPIINELYLGTRYPIFWILCVNNIGELITIPSTDNVIGLPVSRIIDGYNPINGSTYNLDSTTFSNIINNRSDLAILHVIESTVTGFGGSITTHLSITDARKFLNSGDSILPITWTSDNAQGNFKTLEALNTWLIYNSTFNNTVIVKGTFAIDSNLIFDYPNPVIFKGDGAIFNISIAQGITLGNNITFKNIQFNYNYIALGDGTYNSSNLVNSSNALLYCLIDAVNENITIEDCSFYYSNGTLAINRYPFISFEFVSLSSAAQNINILNNKFITSTTNVSADDLRAVIVFTNKLTTGSVNVFGIRLENCHIENNFCNKNQMIIISSDTDGVGGNLGNINNALTTISTSIKNNICGSICFATRSDTPTNFSNTNLINDKYNSLIISENNCKYIANTDSWGQVIENVNVVFFPRSSPVTIEKNICSWIHLAPNVTSSSLKDKKGPIVINNNILSGYNATFLNNFTDTTNTAISVILGNLINSTDVLINGNRISTGEFTPSIDPFYVGSLSTYDYKIGIYTEHTATITNNIFNNLTGESGCTFISSNCSYSNITNNKFYRGSTSIGSYINLNNTGDHTVVNNFFDSTTINGTLETLTINIPYRTTYTNNKNQTETVLISLFDCTTNFTINSSIVSRGFYFNDSSGTEFLQVGQNISPSSYTIISDQGTTAAPVARRLQFAYNLSKYLPDSVNIIEAKIGIMLNDGGATIDYTSGNTEATLGINVSKISDTILDVFTLYNVGTALDTSNQEASIFALNPITSAVTTSTQYLTLNTFTTPSLYVVGNNRNLDTVFTLRYHITTLGSQIVWVMSPIRIKYIY